MSTSVIPTRSAYPFSSVIFSYPFCLLAWRDLRTWHWGVKKFVLALILIRASKRFSWYPVEDFWQCRCWQISSSIEIGGANAEKSCPLETKTKRKITAYSLGRYKHTFYYGLLFFLPVSPCLVKLYLDLLELASHLLQTHNYAIDIYVVVFLLLAFSLTWSIELVGMKSS